MWLNGAVDAATESAVGAEMAGVLAPAAAEPVAAGTMAVRPSTPRNRLPAAHAVEMRRRRWGAGRERDAIETRLSSVSNGPQTEQNGDAPPATAL
jgi:hypothetical protein